MKYMLITNDPSIASFAVANGVGRVFVDLEINGKYERQGGRDTLISNHSISDIYAVRKAIGDAELLVRLNPIYSGTQEELEQVIDAGADMVMLPMFKTVEEVRLLSNLVSGRVGIVPLFETPESIEEFSVVLDVNGISEVFIGLNDLHMALEMSFMFEPLANGMIDAVADKALSKGIPFGFGGIARIGEGLVVGEMVLAEHLRLNSSSVILSRTFAHGESAGAFDKEAFKLELKKLKALEEVLSSRSIAKVDEDRRSFIQQVGEVVSKLNQAKT